MFLAFGFGLEFAELFFSGSLFFLEFLGSLFGFSKLTLFLFSKFFETFLCRGLFRGGLRGGFLPLLPFFFFLSFLFSPFSGFLFGSLKLLTEAPNVGVFSHFVSQFAVLGSPLLGGALFTFPAFLNLLVFSGLAFLVLAFLLLLGFLSPFTLSLFALPRGLRGSFAFLFGLVLVASLLFGVAFLSGFFSVLGLLVLA